MATFPPLPSVFAEAPPPPAHEFAGRWRRLFAFVLDALLLGLVVSLVASFFFEPLSHLGGWGRVIGCLIAVFYFGVMDGRAGQGQSVGKRLLRVRVVDAHGNPVGAAASFIRTLVFCIPYFLNGFNVAMTRTPGVVIWGLKALVVGAAVATAYLLLFNTPSRQGLHDLAAGTYVVNAVQVEQIAPQRVRDRDWIMVVSLLLAFWLLMTLGGRWLSGLGAFPELRRDLQAVEAIPQVQSAGVATQTSLNAEGESTHHLIVRILWTGKEEDEEDLADRAAAAILQHDPSAAKFDTLRIVIVRGYDLGLTSSYRTQSFEHTPAQWD